MDQVMQGAFGVQVTPWKLVGYLDLRYKRGVSTPDQVGGHPHGASVAHR